MEKPSLKSLLQFPSLPFSCEEAPLWQHSWGDIRIILPLPTCKCYAIKDRLHSACSKRRWVFSFLSTFKWKELRNWHFKNWWVRLRMACGEEWSYEWANGETRETDWLCGERAQVDCFFWVCEWKLQMLRTPPPNKDFHWLVLQDFVFFKKTTQVYPLSMLMQSRRNQIVVKCCDEYLYAYLIWFECCMVCAFMFLIWSVTCVLDVDGTCWRLWETQVIVWERGVVCVQWFPVAFVFFWGV